MLNRATSEPVASNGTAATRNLSGANRRTRHRERLYARLKEHPSTNVSQGEVDAHFEEMPSRYWERVTKSELIWGLETVRAYFGKVAAGGTASATAVVADSRHYPERGFSKVMICARDRLGLLAKIAAAFSALRINILRADVYTRADNLALDLFEVCELDHSHAHVARRLSELIFLLEGALSEPPRFVSIWAGQFHKSLARPPAQAPQVEFDNDASTEHTIIRIAAADRLGLLHDLLQALTECGVNIDQAVVETTDHLALDLFYVTDLKRLKILDPHRLEKLRKALVQSVTS
jgi:[protein-PII] uridylyltransferase